MALTIGDMAVDPPVLLAPMAGISDLPFRQLVLEFGAGLVVSEMVASQEMVQAKPGVRERAALGLGEARTAVQLAARDPHWAARAARMAQANGARIIDLNMGCPARKVVGGLSGAALMREPELARDIVRAVVGAVRVPVTLKMRLGWDADSLNAAEIARMAEAEGVAMLTVHGRSRAQFYKGRADWAGIAAVKHAVALPVIANGDIDSPASARMALAQSGADGVMIGRGAGGRPWLPAQVAHEIYGSPAPRIPRAGALVALVTRHLRANIAFYGPDLGVRVLRKHLGWYMDEAATAPGMRRQVLTARDPARIEALLPEALSAERRAA